MTAPENQLVSILLTKDAHTEMEAARLESVDLATLPAWTCDNPYEAKALDEVLDMVQARIRRLEEVKKTITEPLAKAKAAVDTLFRQVAAPYEDAKATIKEKLEAFETRRLEARRAALAAANQATQEGDREAAHVALQAAAQASEKSTASFRYVWEWELEDIRQVPVEFLALNAASMKLYASRFKDSDTIEGIPGVRFKRVPKAVAR